MEFPDVTVDRSDALMTLGQLQNLGLCWLRYPPPVMLILEISCSVCGQWMHCVALSNSSGSTLQKGCRTAPDNSGRDLRVLGQHLFLVVSLAVNNAWLSVIVQPANTIQQVSLCATVFQIYLYLHIYSYTADVWFAVKFIIYMGRWKMQEWKMTSFPAMRHGRFQSCIFDAPFVQLR